MRLQETLQNSIGMPGSPAAMPPHLDLPMQQKLQTELRPAQCTADIYNVAQPRPGSSYGLSPGNFPDHGNANPDDATLGGVAPRKHYLEGAGGPGQPI